MLGALRQRQPEQLPRHSGNMLPVEKASPAGAMEGRPQWPTLPTTPISHR